MDAALRHYASDGNEHREAGPEQKECHQIRGVRHRQCGSARERDGQRDLPRRGHASEHQQHQEQRGPRYCVREERRERGRTHGDDGCDVELCCPRKLTPRQTAGVCRHSAGQTTGSQLGSVQLVPQTTVSPSSPFVPQTTVSPLSVPQTTVSPSSVPTTSPPLLATVHVV